jgi:hypothetical protein
MAVYVSFFGGDKTCIVVANHGRQNEIFLYSLADKVSGL